MLCSMKQDAEPDSIYLTAVLFGRLIMLPHRVVAPTSAVKSSLHRQHMLMLDALTLPKMLCYINKLQ